MIYIEAWLIFIVTLVLYMVGLGIYLAHRDMKDYLDEKAEHEAKEEAEWAAYWEKREKDLEAVLRKREKNDAE